MGIVYTGLEYSKTYIIPCATETPGTGPGVTKWAWTLSTDSKQAVGIG